jgi:hypothetical protein
MHTSYITLGRTRVYKPDYPADGFVSFDLNKLLLAERALSRALPRYVMFPEHGMLRLGSISPQREVVMLCNRHTQHVVCILWTFQGSCNSLSIF